MAETPEEYRTQAKAAAERYLATCSEYTSPFEREKLINNWVEKDSAARSVVDDFTKRVGNPAGKRVFDFGFGNAQYAVGFAQAGAEVAGVEVNETLVDLAKENAAAQGVQADLQLYDGDRIPFGDNSFDYAYSLSVLEHVSDLRGALKEIARVVKPGGAFYLSYPNRFRPRETHTGILFLSYLPHPVAEFVMKRVLKRNAMEELNLHFLTYFSLVRAVRGLPLSIRMEYYGTSAPRRALKRVLGALGIHFSALLGTVVVILDKTP